MPLALRGSSATPAINDAINNITIPAEAIAGDVAVLAWTFPTTYSSDASVTGFTFVGESVSGTALYTRIYTREIVEGDAGDNVVLNAGLSMKHTAVMAVFSGIDADTPIEVWDENTYATADTTRVGSGLSYGVYADGFYQISVVADRGSPSTPDFTEPSGYTMGPEVYGTLSGSTSIALAYNTTSIASSGSTSDVSWGVDSGPPRASVFTIGLRAGLTAAPPSVNKEFTFEEFTPGELMEVSPSFTSITGAPEYTADAIHGSVAVDTSGSVFRLDVPDDSRDYVTSVYVKVDDASSTTPRVIQFQNEFNANAAQVRMHLGTQKFQIGDAGVTALDVSDYTWQYDRVYRVDTRIQATDTEITLTARIFYPPESAATDFKEELSATFPIPALVQQITVGGATAGSVTVHDTLRFKPWAFDEAWYDPFDPGAFAPPGFCDFIWGGSPKANDFVVSCKTEDTTSLQLAVSLSPTMSTPSYFSPTDVPDSLGYSRFEVNNRNPDTVWYYQVEDGGVPISEVGQIKTLPSPGVVVPSFNVGLGACTLLNLDEPAAIQSIIEFDPKFFIHTGDFYYTDSQSTDPVTFENLYSNMIQTYPSFKDFCRLLGWYYNVSDHEAGPDNGDSNNAWTDAMRTAYASVVPHDGGAPNTLYRSWVVGRIRFIQLDIRNPDRSPGGNADVEGKTMLGATQKAWLFNELVQQEPLKIIISDVAWQGPPSLINGADKWWSYATERQEIIDFINSRNVTVEMWMGDSHSIGYTTPEDNDYGGFATILSAPIAQTGGGRNLAEFTEVYNTDGVHTNQYVRITFQDDGEVITRTAVGYDATNEVVRWTNVQTYDSIQVLPELTEFSWWDGETEVPLDVSIWNGYTEIPCDPELTSEG